MCKIHVTNLTKDVYDRLRILHGVIILDQMIFVEYIMLGEGFQCLSGFELTSLHLNGILNVMSGPNKYLTLCTLCRRIIIFCLSNKL